MDWTKFPQRHPNRVKIHELSKSRYDSWVVPPPLNQLPIGIKNRPKHFGNIRTDFLITHILGQLEENEPLFSKLSEESKKLIRWSISFSYSSINLLDFDEGGDGMIIPTFVEIMHRFLFAIRESGNFIDYKDDLEIYHKYFWAFELKCLLNSKYLIDDNSIAS